MKDRLIIVINPQEVIEKRINNIVNHAKVTFLSNPKQKKMLFPISDGFYNLTTESVEIIKNKLNQQSNLFGIYLNVSILYNPDFDDYIQVRRA